jgi:hypothetical protein
MHRNESDQEKLERLKRLDEGNRDRSKKYLEKVKKAGFKQISAFLNAEAYDRLCKLRDAGYQAGERLSFGDIIGRLLVPIVNIDDKSNTKARQVELAGTRPSPLVENLPPSDKESNVKDNVNIDVIYNTEEIPDCHSKDLTQNERDNILITVGKLYPGPENTQQRADVLNNRGIPVKRPNGEWIRETWTRKRARDHIWLAKKRQAKKNSKK